MVRQSLYSIRDGFSELRRVEKTFGFPAMNTYSYYDILGVSPRVDFQALKEAYYKRAKECHPDRFHGDPRKEEEFKRLVHAFDTLSDPLRRGHYDSWLGADSHDSPQFFVLPDDDEAVMDSIADDILEEIIVGNNIPRHATLQYLMQDLENTEKFIRFRRAKTLYYQGRVRTAHRLFQDAVNGSPNNILYRYYLAQSLRRLNKSRQAIKQLTIGLELGLMRVPPQRLHRFRRQIERLRDRRRTPLGRWFTKWIKPAPPRELTSTPEDMCREMSRAMRRLERRRAANRKLLR